MNAQSLQARTWTRFAVAAAMMSIVVACGDTSSPGQASDTGNRLSPFTVSNAVARNSGASATSGGASPAAAHIVYVALASGTIPNADLVTIHSRANGAIVSAHAVDGGLDPVAIAAEPGDALDLTVQLTGGAPPEQFAMTVPLHAPPVVIRTTPPRGKRDVPLNERFLIVFSEPISTSALATGAVAVTTGNVHVAGTVAFADSAHLSVTFTPIVPLAPATDYTLAITQAVTDLQGEPLQSPVTIEFSTTPTPPPPALQPGPLAGWLVVSSPVKRGDGAESQSVVYVSLPPGHVNPTDVVVIRNLRTNATQRLTVTTSVFDPVAIPADLGDIVDVAVTAYGYGTTTNTQVRVAAGRPVRVIRTIPADTTDGVAVDAPISVVFSEPLDSAYLPAGIRLRHGSEDVAAALTLDSSGTRATVRPSVPLVSGAAYRLDISRLVTGASGNTLAGDTGASFSTAPIGVAAAVSEVTGDWDATSWRFTGVLFADRGRWDDPVVGWGPNNYYRIHLTVAPGPSNPPGSVSWRMTITWVLGGGGGPDSAFIAGDATVATRSWVGRTTASPWLAFTSNCEDALRCMLQDIYDFARDGNELTFTRHATFLYNDSFELWPARETLTLRRASP